VYYCGINVQGRGVIRNLSLEGCQIEGGVAVKPATKLTLVLTLPNGYAPVVVDRTIVVWSDGNRFGLRHELLLPKERTQLERFLDDSGILIADSDARNITKIRASEQGAPISNGYP